MLVVLTTCPAAEAAEALAEQIVEARLAACVQVLPQMTSIYVWEGEIQKEGEVLLLIKTLPDSGRTSGNSSPRITHTRSPRSSRSSPLWSVINTERGWVRF